jgi:hypothetical protein
MISGFDVLKLIEQCGSEDGTPTRTIKVCDSGEYNPAYEEEKVTTIKPARHFTGLNFTRPGWKKRQKPDNQNASTTNYPATHQHLNGLSWICAHNAQKNMMRNGRQSYNSSETNKGRRARITTRTKCRPLPLP